MGKLNIDILVWKYLEMFNQGSYSHLCWLPEFSIEDHNALLLKIPRKEEIMKPASGFAANLGRKTQMGTVGGRQ